MRTLAIGDIHGCLRAFDTLLESIDLRSDDLLVTLGDYVDRGPDAKGVIDRLIGLRELCRHVALTGNHDLMMLAAREDVEHFNEWLGYGGKQTLESYRAKSDFATFANAVPDSHWRFVKDRCRPFYQINTHFFVHANVHPDLPLEEQPDYMLFWEHLQEHDSRPHESGKIMICGHTQQRSGRPLVLDHAICIDTWACGDGWLTCLDVEMQAYWQANQQGQTRMGNLGFRAR
jgi:serine/threonine protein phosphatase 1